MGDTERGVDGLLAAPGSAVPRQPTVPRLTQPVSGAGGVTFAKQSWARPPDVLACHATQRTRVRGSSSPRLADRISPAKDSLGEGRAGAG